MERGKRMVDLVLNSANKCLQHENEQNVSLPHRESMNLNKEIVNYDEINQPSTSSGVFASMSIDSSPEQSDSSPIPTITKSRRYIIYTSDSDSSNEQPVQESIINIEIPGSSQTPPLGQSMAKRRRLLGKSYMGYKKKDGKLEQNTSKEARSVKSRCSHTAMNKKSKHSFMCGLVSEEERSTLHSKFWNMKTWSEKKAYVQGLVSQRSLRKKRKRDNLVSTTSRKQVGFDIFMPKFDCQNAKVKVCRLFFLNTLDLGRDTFLRWVKDMPAMDHDSTAPPMTGHRHSVMPTRYTSLRGTVVEWLDLLPKVPSHYCRSSSKRIYVESTFLSHMHMHTVYKTWCTEHNKKTCSRNTFLSVLKTNNISIHKPRKDQCDVCCSFQLKNVSQDVYEVHIQKKNEARYAKKIAIENLKSNPDIAVITVDVQSVLLAPKLLAGALYYKQKLQCHNFTIYNSRTADVTIYFWHEADGGVTSNEFTSCLIDYLKTTCKDYKHITIISDGCNYQNRNKVLASTLSNFACFFKVEVEQIILEKGHTMMEVDSVHSTIEHYIKPPIYAPQDYITKIRQARPKQPYDIRVVHYDFFKDYENISTNYQSIRPGKRKGDPTVNDIRAFKYMSSGDVYFKLRHPEDYIILPQRRQVPQEYPEPVPLYHGPLEITQSKFNQLQELKPFIDRDYHPFYDCLKFKSN